MLEIRDLRTAYGSGERAVRAVDGVSLSVGRSENFGLVGESGCGKTTLISSIMRVLGAGGRILGGSVLLEGEDLLAVSEERMNEVRWRKISLVTQSAMNALDPVYRLGDQIVETLRVHTDMSRQAARRRAAELLTMVGLEPSRMTAYPHQLSGGMRQRAVIALALALEPLMIVADEPTTALDVVVQAGIIAELRRLQDRMGNSMILVSHDISLVGQTCQRIGVMYAGKLVEEGPGDEILQRPVHPYTMGLLNAFPTLERAKSTLVSIPGSPPNLASPPAGCRFSSRCPFATERCRVEEPDLVLVGSGHRAACHYPERAEEFRAASTKPETWGGARADVVPTARAEFDREGAVVEVRDVRRYFPLRRGVRSLVRLLPPQRVHAVDGVTFRIRRGEILGLAGESGSGKSTIGEMLVGLQPPSGGAVSIGGRVVSTAHDREFRRRVQMVFQDPYETLNPRFTVEQSVAEPLRNLRIGARADRRRRVEESLRHAGLEPSDDLLARYPHQLSGGQRQRVAIARAIVVEPEILVADEPVSMLDVSIRAGILNLLRTFRDATGTSILYISHDLATIRYVSDRTVVLYLGRIAEIGPTDEVVERPRHPYTQLLVASVPEPGRGATTEFGAESEIPDPIDLPNGCRFHGRCPYAMAHCGWEGRDLLSLIERRRMALLEGGAARPPIHGVTEEEVLEAIVRTVVESTDLTVTVKDGWAGTVAAYLEDVMETDLRSSIAEAAAVAKVGDRTVRVSFSRAEEPPHFQVAPDHAVACFLFAGPEGGSDSPQAELSGEVTQLRIET